MKLILLLTNFSRLLFQFLLYIFVIHVIREPTLSIMQSCNHQDYINTCSFCIISNLSLRILHYPASNANKKLKIQPKCENHFSSFKYCYDFFNTSSNKKNAVESYSGNIWLQHKAMLKQHQNNYSLAKGVMIQLGSLFSNVNAVR